MVCKGLCKISIQTCLDAITAQLAGDVFKDNDFDQQEQVINNKKASKKVRLKNVNIHLLSLNTLNNFHQML